MKYNQLINLLLSPNSSLTGVGSKISTQLKTLVGRGRVFDLLLHQPSRIEKVNLFPRLFEVEAGQKVAAKVKVESHVKPYSPRQPFKVVCYSPTGYVNLIFFKVFPSQIAKMAVGKELVVSGTLQKGPSGENQITHPDISEISDSSKKESLDVIYPLNYAISNKFLRSKILQILSKFKSLDVRKSGITGDTTFVEDLSSTTHSTKVGSGGNLKDSTTHSTMGSTNLKVGDRSNYSTTSSTISDNANSTSPQIGAGFGDGIISSTSSGVDRDLANSTMGSTTFKNNVSDGGPLSSAQGSHSKALDNSTTGSTISDTTHSTMDSTTFEWIESELMREKNWPDFFTALEHLHYVFGDVGNARYLKLWQIARQRLAYDELLAWQIGMMITKDRAKPVKEFVGVGNDRSGELIESLEFELTDDQIKVISEIESEMNSTKKMLRLLQGDVGSGKTIVAMVCALKKIAAGKQVCLLVPTTVLAKQHFGYFKRHLQGFDLGVEILTSATTKKQKEKICAKLLDGSMDIIVSTHAVLEDDVKFKDLGLAIIDEQHRFGVIQRLKLLEKSPNIDALLMSATPIPRSLMMALYGDMDISSIKQKPKNRQEIMTVIMSRGRCEEIYESMRGTIESGQKIYWICPAIEKEEEEKKEEKDVILLNPSEPEDDLDLTTVKERSEELAKFFDSGKIAVVHGKMKEREKSKVMEEFANPESGVDILVATTVIEVGVDVGLATVIIIENAEHFGLAQLHQLRGRVGRSDRKSFCILLYGKKFGLKARQRLNILKQSNDGFFIAEEDLKLRGGGEMLGTKQSGLPLFKIADLDQDADLLKLAHNQAKDSFDKKSLNIENSYSSLLKLFSYDELINVIKSG